MIWVLSCEHYSNHVPSKYAHLFEKGEDVLNSHRGYDIGVAGLFHALAPQFKHVYHYPLSRLLIEPNRSLHHRHLFSAFSLQLDKVDRAELIARHYQPYRSEVENQLKIYKSDQVAHISVHSFTPVLGNQNRDSEIGILFDPSRPQEKELASLWKKKILAHADVKVRFNYPYRGKADGFTTYLRKCFPFNYAGIELEVRNDMIKRLTPAIVDSVIELKSLFD